MWLCGHQSLLTECLAAQLWGQCPWEGSGDPRAASLFVSWSYPLHAARARPATYLLASIKFGWATLTEPHVFIRSAIMRRRGTGVPRPAMAKAHRLDCESLITTEPMPNLWRRPMNSATEDLYAHRSAAIDHAHITEGHWGVGAIGQNARQRRRRSCEPFPWTS